MATLTITRGLPGSGKTTWAKAQRGAARVNRDELRRMLHGGHTGAGWAEKQVSVTQRAMITALLTAGVNVISDDTNLSPKVVRELADLALNVGAAVKLEDFTGVPIEVCVERDATRPEAEQVGREVIAGMYQRHLSRGRGRVELPAAVEVSKYEPSLDLPPAILVDLDGTVAVMGDRSPYDTQLVHLDTPNAPVIDAVRAMHAAGHTIIYCSGRTDDYRHMTEAWLAEHVGVPYAALYMRRKGDGRKDAAVKRDFFEDQIRQTWRVIAVFDDRNQVVQMWRALGLTVFQVADGSF